MNSTECKLAVMTLYLNSTQFYHFGFSSHVEFVFIRGVNWALATRILCIRM